MVITMPKLCPWVRSDVKLLFVVDLQAQLKVLSLETSRYTPVKDLSHGGIIMLKNSKPEEKEDIVETVQAGGPKAEDEEEEPEAPEPFEWTED